MEKRLYNVLTLCFRSPEREAAFLADYRERAIPLSRLALLLGCLQFGMYGFMDAVMIPEALRAALTIRLSVSAFILLAVGFTFTRAYRRHWQAWTSLVPVVTGLGLIGIDIADRSAIDRYDYYAGQMLVLFYVNVLLRLRFVYAAAVSWALIGLYFAASVFITDLPSEYVLNNTSYLLTAITSGMVASWALEYYARSVFHGNEQLDARHRQLKAEDRRKSRELEEMRQLQLSMLPDRLPEHPVVDIAVFMKTAVEIGGDYYDFDVAGDGTLTFAIGDATGHGARAGAMVTAAKILFASLHAEPDLLEILRKATAPLKRVGENRLFMAFALGRLRGRTLELAGAGMPPALLYRAATGTVEEVSLSGMPLGGFAGFPYRKSAVELAPGDTVLLLSDGFPELFNRNGEMMGYERAATLLAGSGSGTAEAVIEHFKQAAFAWLGRTGASGPLREDDLTFIVLKVKP